VAVIGSRAADQITFLDIVDAVEGRKPLFDCREIRGRCAVFDDPPRWATRGVFAIHAVMLRVENVMRAELSRSSLADIALAVELKAPASFAADLDSWITLCMGARVPRAATKRVS
jgi:DNA-binding IscR family transcriptional regulator